VTQEDIDLYHKTEDISTWSARMREPMEGTRVLHRLTYSASRRKLALRGRRFPVIHWRNTVHQMPIVCLLYAYCTLIVCLLYAYWIQSNKEQTPTTHESPRAWYSRHAKSPLCQCPRISLFNKRQRFKLLLLFSLFSLSFSTFLEMYGAELFQKLWTNWNRYMVMILKNANGTAFCISSLPLALLHAC
jgi:hypothetical protein